jgi:hypothetical protein
LRITPHRGKGIVGREERRQAGSRKAGLTAGTAKPCERAQCRNRKGGRKTVAAERNKVIFCAVSLTEFSPRTAKGKFNRPFGGLCVEKDSTHAGSGLSDLHAAFCLKSSKDFV